MSHNPEVYAPGVPKLNVAPPPKVSSRAPVSSDINYPIGQMWIYGGDSYQLVSKSAGAATWNLLASSVLPASLTDHGVLVGSGNDPITALAVGTNGQVLVGSTGADPAFATLSSADSSISFTAGAGSLALAVNRAIEGALNYADVTLTATEIKALATTPIELVAAPAAGASILFQGALLKLNYGGNNVFTEAGDNLGIKYTNAAGVQVCADIECTNFIDQAADTYTNAIPSANAIVAAAAAEAQALVLDNLGNNFAGNAADDNTLSIRVYYTVQSL